MQEGDTTEAGLGQGPNISPSIPWAGTATCDPPAASIPGSGVGSGHRQPPPARRMLGTQPGVEGGTQLGFPAPHPPAGVPRLQRAGEADELLITGAAWLVQRVSAARLAEPCGG